MNRTMWIAAALMGFGLRLNPSAANAQEAAPTIHIAHGESCAVCGMYIEEFKRTAVQIAFADGRTQAYCGLACALRAVNENLGMEHVKSALATDWDTQEAIALSNATVVAGSDIVPDMIPNLIAFRSEGAARAFQQKHGGQIMPLDRALVAISFQGMTTPFRVPPAATPPARLYSAGVAVTYMRKAELLQGRHDADAARVLQSKPMVPDKMESTKASAQAGYAITDDLFLGLGVPYLWKDLEMKTRQGDKEIKKIGLGDVDLSARYRLWHDLLYDRHFGVSLDVSLPTGDFDNAQRARPGLQLGYGATAVGAGLLYSQHLGLFWAHASVGYAYAFENGDDYRFGDVLRGGLALHYTPSTRTMIGVEVDGNISAKNEDNGNNVANTGCDGVYASLVGQQRIALVWGGNMDARAIVGAPIYEHVNDVQLGETVHAGAAVQWKRRF